MYSGHRIFRIYFYEAWDITKKPPPKLGTPQLIEWALFRINRDKSPNKPTGRDV